MSVSPLPATTRTAELHERALTALGDGLDDFERATRGLIATLDGGVIERDGAAIWDVARYDFVRDHETAPDTVHPGLWRQARLNCIHGLFEVVPGVWQVRGYDLSNITFVAGETGWIVIDPLTAAETAAAALGLANDRLGARPVVAVIHTHSHIDHFGGVLGVTSRADVDAGRCRIIAPRGFLDEAVSENVVAGPAMFRRAMYMYGGLLPASPTGQVDAGLGKATPLGTVGVLAPTEEIEVTGTELMVDGVRIVFQSTPGTEAPAEMNFHFPDLRLLCMAENCTHTMHNLYTPRGAQVRDALAWSRYIHEAIELFADETDVCFASHHWPRFGAADARRFLEQQRDLYRWLHDQTMRLANHGLTPTEISEAMELAPELQSELHAQGYYGTVSHNVKAVYQRYLGWFDGNPANLHPHPPVETARRTVEYMGGADAVLARARRDLAEGDHRWVAQVVNHVVFAEPDNTEARELQAEALEQLGYQAESAPWRNFYLTGAQELRSGTFDFGHAVLGGFAPAMTTEMLFDAWAIRLDPAALAGVGTEPISVVWHLVDRGERRSVGLSNRTLFHWPAAAEAVGTAGATATCDTGALISLIDATTTVDDAVASGALVLTGDETVVRSMGSATDRFPRIFPIVTP